MLWVKRQPCLMRGIRRRDPAVLRDEHARVFRRSTE
jgi:hypothetical protein